LINEAAKLALQRTGGAPQDNQRWTISATTPAVHEAGASIPGLVPITSPDTLIVPIASD
jgi:hypothetical protein